MLKNTKVIWENLCRVTCIFLVINLNVPISVVHAEQEDAFHKGVCFTTWTRDKFSSTGAKQALEMFRGFGAGHVQINVTEYQARHDSFRIRSTERTPRKSSIIKAIRKAHKTSLKVMLKPHIDIIKGGGENYCRKDIGFQDNVSWKKWFGNYEKFIVSYAKLAEKENVEMFCIGTELSFASRKTESWREIISKIRSVYSGELIYAANWDNYESVNFWEDLDYVGINAYFPLSEEESPTIEEIKAGWRVWINRIEAWHKTIKKPIIFTEIGYASYAGAAREPWKGGTGEVDTLRQANCYTAFFEVVWWREWFKGAYWWNFKPMIYGGGMRDRGFTPMNKPAMEILKKWYKSDRIIFKDRQEEKNFLAISFTRPQNLHNKFLQFKIKSREEIKSLRFVLRDHSTRCSPDIRLDDITRKWKTFSINIEKEAFDFVDTSQIDNIRFEILSPKCTEKEWGSMLLVEEIKVF
ncbi:MAG: hypothetical protein ISS33_05205 [Candidatus Omnitrophica bacterium]|nr:hypothetical protein [Candidatus Omnitrophota bacterium]